MAPRTGVEPVSTWRDKPASTAGGLARRWCSWRESNALASV